MSMLGGVVSNAALDSALNELGMLSTITNSRQEYMLEMLQQQSSRLAALDISEDPANVPLKSKGGSRTRASSMSMTGHVRKRKDKLLSPLSRKLLTNRCNVMKLSLVPMQPSSSRILLPVESAATSKLFKSRSMESIDAHTSDESVCATERELNSDSITSTAEVDSMSSGLHRLHVSE